jgi:hypothetical protein
METQYIVQIYNPAAGVDQKGPVWPHILKGWKPKGLEKGCIRLFSLQSIQDPVPNGAVQRSALSLRIWEVRSPKLCPESKTLPGAQNTARSPKLCPESKTLPGVQNSARSPKLCSESKTLSGVQNSARSPTLCPESKTLLGVQNSARSPKLCLQTGCADWCHLFLHPFNENLGQYLKLGTTAYFQILSKSILILLEAISSELLTVSLSKPCINCRCYVISNEKRWVDYDWWFELGLAVPTGYSCYKTASGDGDDPHLLMLTPR